MCKWISDRCRGKVKVLPAISMADLSSSQIQKIDQSTANNISLKPFELERFPKSALNNSGFIDTSLVDAETYYKAWTRTFAFR